MEHIPRAQPCSCMLLECCLYMYVCLRTCMLVICIMYTHMGYTIINSESCRKRKEINYWLCCCSDFAAIVCILF